MPRVGFFKRLALRREAKRMTPTEHIHPLARKQAIEEYVARRTREIETGATDKAHLAAQKLVKEAEAAAASNNHNTSFFARLFGGGNKRKHRDPHLTGEIHEERAKKFLGKTKPESPKNGKK